MVARGPRRWQFNVRFRPKADIKLGALSCYRTAMTAFTELELAALHSIVSETAELAPQFERQLSVATVTGRENTGVGFFTTISMPPTTVAIDRVEPLSGETHARVPGLEHGLGFVLFLADGRIETLEAFTYGSESTSSLDLANLSFEIVREPVNRVS